MRVLKIGNDNGCCLSWSYCKKCHRPVVKRKTFTSLAVLKAGKSKIKVLGENPLSGLQVDAFLLYLHMAEAEFISCGSSY